MLKAKDTENVPVPACKCGGKAHLIKNTYVTDGAFQYRTYFVKCSCCSRRTLEYSCRDEAANAWRRLILKTFSLVR